METDEEDTASSAIIGVDKYVKLYYCIIVIIQNEERKAYERIVESAESEKDLQDFCQTAED